MNGTVIDMDRESIAAVIDHTNLAPDAGPSELRQLCEEAERHGFASVCVYSSDVAFVDELVEEVRVCSVVGFPHGRTATNAKAAEARHAVNAGADEVDVVINQGCLKRGEIDAVIDDIREVRDAVPEALIKVILETCNLTDDETQAGCMAAVRAGADFVKTSTGFGSHGAREDDVALMASTLDELDADLGIKASGGLRGYEDVRRMVEAAGLESVEPGRFRVGTSSGVQILESVEVER